MSKYLNEIFNDIELDATIIDVYDGDTVTIEAEFPGVKKLDGNPLLIKFKLRMMGYDTSEKRTKDPNEKRIALLCRDKLAEKILNKKVKVRCQSLDKYGRLLGTIICNNENVNQFMLDKNYGYAYGGKTKKKPIYHEDNSYTIDGKVYKIG